MSHVLHWCILCSQDGNDGVHASGGPMCRSARDMEMIIKAVESKKPWQRDPSLVPIILQLPDVSQRKLRVGVMFHDGAVLPHPPILRALKVAKQKLDASEDVEVVGYVPYKHKEGYNIAVRRFI